MSKTKKKPATSKKITDNTSYKGVKCPRCGSHKVQLSSERSKHGFLWFIIFGFFWLMWWMVKACAAICVLLFFDWWYAIIKHNEGKGYIWLSKRIIQNKSKIYYCHNCSNNFRG